MPRSSKATPASRKRPAAGANKAAKAAPPKVSLTPGLSLDLFAASRYLDLEAEQ